MNKTGTAGLNAAVAAILSAVLLCPFLVESADLKQKESTAQDLMLMSPYKWAGLTQREQDLFTLGVLEDWGFILYSYQAPGLQDFVACANNEKPKKFNSLMWQFGNIKESAAREISKMTPIVCSSYQGKGGSLRKPLQLLTKKDWTSFNLKEKSLYLMGYLEIGYLINKDIDPEIPRSLENCVSGEGIEGILSQVVRDETNFEWQYPIPWSISSSLGKVCQKHIKNSQS